MRLLTEQRRRNTNSLPLPQLTHVAVLFLVGSLLIPSLLPWWLVSKNNDAGTERLHTYKSQNLSIDPLCEQPLSAAQDNRMNHEPVPIDEIMLHQRVH